MVSKKGYSKEGPKGAKNLIWELSANQGWVIRDVPGLEGVDHTQQVFGNVGHGNEVRLSFSTLFGIVFGKNRLI